MKTEERGAYDTECNRCAPSHLSTMSNSKTTYHLVKDTHINNNENENFLVTFGSDILLSWIQLLHFRLILRGHFRKEEVKQ